jgi:hypothetical protein
LVGGAFWSKVKGLLFGHYRVVLLEQFYRKDVAGIALQLARSIFEKGSIEVSSLHIPFNLSRDLLGIGSAYRGVFKLKAKAVSFPLMPPTQS